MRTRSLSHLTDGVLLGELDSLLARDRDTTAEMLLYLAEVERRKLYVPAGYPSMYMYCLGVLRFSEDSACQRLRAARAARHFPAILEMVADGRLHLSGAALLSRYLTPGNAKELLAAATHRSKRAIEHLLAERFPQNDLPTLVRPIGPASECVTPVPGQAELAANSSTGPADLMSLTPVPGRVELAASPTADSADLMSLTPVPGRVPPTAAPNPRISPIASARYAVQFTMPQSLHDKLRQAQALLAHEAGSADLPEVFERALDVLIAQLEKRKFAATRKPRASRASRNPRTIPAEVRRAVRERDQGQCTFVADSGHRCESRVRLEFDHIEPVARGGQATVENIRLRCRAHNQYEAECAFGEGFMHEKRERAARGAEVRRPGAAA